MDFQTTFIVAQIAGISCLLFYLLGTQAESRKTLLVLRLLSDAFSGVQYFFLGATTGLFLNILAVFRDIFVPKKKKYLKTYIIVFAMLDFIVGIIFFDGILSMLIVARSMLATFAVCQRDLPRYRVTEFLATPLSIIYNFSVMAYGGVITNIVQMIFLAIGVERFDKLKIKRRVRKKIRIIEKERGIPEEKSILKRKRGFTKSKKRV